jgi:hypothetical protein
MQNYGFQYFTTKAAFVSLKLATSLEAPAKDALEKERFELG